MTITEVENMMDEIGIPVSYYKFDEGSGIQPPFAVWYFPFSNDVMADNINYVDVRQLVIELYTDEKDFELEETIKQILIAHELPCAYSEDYLSDEMMFVVSFESEVMLNA